MTAATKRLFSHLTYRYLKGRNWKRLGFAPMEMRALRALERRNLIEMKKYQYDPKGCYFAHWVTVRLTKLGKNNS